MNASVLLLLLSSFHGKEQYGFPLLGVLPTTEWQKKVEMPLEESCPDPTDIEPCECTNLDNLVMDCSNVQDEEQLREVFSAFFPVTELYSFTMHENHGVKVLEDGVFGNVSFQELDIYGSVLETVETDALTPSLSTLTSIYLTYCMLEIFPFDRLTEFTSLQQLRLPFNNIHTLPALSSASLRIVDLSFNLISDLTPDVFTHLPVVEEIYLDINQLTEIPKGTFTGLPKLEVLNLYGNNISYLQSFTIELASSSNTNLYLHNNIIDSMDVDAFEGVPEYAIISIESNALTRLPEEIWRPVLEKNITVEFYGNDLACGCDVAWLVRAPELQTMASQASCADGTLLADLNPTDFDICG